MYQGKDEARGEETATAYPIKRLLDNTKFWFKGMCLFIDNWYSSFPIAKWLVEKGFEFCGRIRLNRKGVPKPHAFIAGKKNCFNTYCFDVLD